MSIFLLSLLKDACRISCLLPWMLVVFTNFAEAGSPVLLGFHTNGLNASHVRLQRSTTNVCMAGFLQPQSFQLYSVTNPAAPTKTGGLALAHSGDRLTLSRSETHAFMVGFFGGMKILSITNPAAPELLGTYVAGGNGKDVVVSADGSKAFVALDGGGVEVVSVTNPAAAFMIGENDADFGGSAGALGLVLSGDERLLYVAAASGGIKVLSITNPAAPCLAGAYSPALVSPMNTAFISNDGQHLFTLGGGSVGEFGLRVLSLTNPASPSLLFGYEDPIRSGAFADMALTDDGCTAFLVGNNVGLQVVDVSPGMAPEFVTAFYEVIGGAAPQTTGVALSRDAKLAYLADGINGLRVVDVSGVYDIDDDGIPNAWERLHFESVTGAVHDVDSDGDAQSNLEEYIAGTNPQNVTSLFEVVSVTHSSPVRIEVPSLENRLYSLVYADHPGLTNAWLAASGAQDVPGADGVLFLEDTNAASARFYRVDVRLEAE